MKKRIIPILTSIICAAAAVPMSSAAEAPYYWGTADSSQLAEYLKDYEEIDDHKENSRLFNHIDRDYEYLILTPLITKFELYVSNDLSYNEFREIAKSVLPEFTRFTNFRYEDYDIPAKEHDTSELDANKNLCYYEAICQKQIDIDPARAEELCAAIREKAAVASCRYTLVMYYQKGYTPREGILYYRNYEWMGYDGTNMGETLTAYVEDNDLDFEVEIAPTDEQYKYNREIVNVMSYKLVPTREMSRQEQFDTALRIRDDLNISFVMECPESVNAPLNNGAVELVNNVKGDANCDGEVTIADSTAILQAVGNPDKYGLTPQGKYNADVCGNNDGVSGLDALEIQKFDAKLIDKLE